MIHTRTEFTQYCLRKLGHPVMRVNVAPEQIEDRIDDALEKFWSFHGDGSQRTYVNYTLVPEDWLNRYIVLPNQVLSVVRMVKGHQGSYSQNLEYQSFMTDVIQSVNGWGLGLGSGRGYADGGTVGSYAIAMSHMSLIDDWFNAERSLRFNHYQGKIYIDDNWNEWEAGDVLTFECYVHTDPEIYSRAWNDEWLKAYATALIKRQQGINSKKYQGFQLPSGMVLNGQVMFDEAQQEITLLEQQLYDTYSYPADFCVG